MTVPFVLHTFVLHIPSLMQPAMKPRRCGRCLSQGKQCANCAVETAMEEDLEEKSCPECTKMETGVYKACFAGLQQEVGTVGAPWWDQLPMAWDQLPMAC